jgi:hypothetical protein
MLAEPLGFRCGKEAVKVGMVGEIWGENQQL